MKGLVIVMKKKALSILLAIAMMLTMMPAMALTAFADDEVAATEATQVEAVKAAPVGHPYVDPLAEQRAAAIADIEKLVEDFYSDAAKQIAAEGIEWVKKAWTAEGITAIQTKTKEDADAMEDAAADAQGDLAEAAGTNLEGAVLAIYEAYRDRIYDVDNVNLYGKTPQERMAAIAEEGVAAIEAMQALQKKATEDVNRPGFDASLFGLTDAEKAKLDEIAQNIVDGKIYGPKGVYVEDFRELKHAVNKEILAKADEQAADATDEEKAAVEEAQKYAWHEVAKADTYEELINARNVGLTAIEKAIAPQFVENVLTLNAKASGKKAVKLSWAPVKGATSYTVYANKCGKKFKKVATTSSTSFKLKKIGKSKLKKHKAYKFYVVSNTGVKSNNVHFFTAKTQGKYANVKSISAKSTVTLKKNGNTSAAASYKLPKKKKHIKKTHGAAFTYSTDNAYVATVSANGTITAKHCGTANITVHDINGLNKVVKVTVNGYEAQ